MKRVLLVDDTLHILEELRDILEMEGFEVDTAIDAREGLTKLGAKIPDLVITDLRMPKMSGMEFLAEIKKTESYKDLPVIILSANAEKENIDKAKELKASGYLKKPCSVEDLLDAINNVID